MTEKRELLGHMKRVLLPVDRSGASRRAVKFAACLLAPFCGELVEEVILLHVLGTSYLEKMAANIDTRILDLKETPLFRKLAEEYVEREVNPLLDEMEGLLAARGLSCRVRKEVIEGEPSREIVNFAQREGLQTIFIGRRRRAALAERVLGSCSSSLCHRPGRHTDYLVGEEEIEGACPIPKILVPVDGSPAAEKALREAVALACAFPGEVVTVGLVHVVELAYLENLERRDEAEQVIEGARRLALDMGLEERLLETEVRFGEAAEEIVRVAEEGGYNIIMMGRTGKGSLKEIILGSVSMKVVHQATRPTVALVSA